jgi:hypothetical protein
VGEIQNLIKAIPAASQPSPKPVQAEIHCEQLGDPHERHPSTVSSEYSWRFASWSVSKEYRKPHGRLVGRGPFDSMPAMG